MVKKIQKLSKFLKKWMPLFITLTIITALIFGNFIDINSALKKVVLPMMIIMLIPSMMGLDIEELKLVIKDKKLLSIAALLNFIISPILAYILILMFFRGQDGNFIAGWILKMTIPCGAMYIAFTGMIKGKTESALVIQLMSFLLTIFFVPFWLTILAHSYISISLIYIIQKIFIIIVIPMIIGIMTREIIIRKTGHKHFNQEIKPFLPPMSTLAMYFLIFAGIAMEAKVILSNLNLIGIAIIALIIMYFSLFFIALYTVKKFHFRYENGITIILSSIVKNNGIPLALAIGALGGLAVLPVALSILIQLPAIMIIHKLSPKIEKYLNA